MNKSRDAHLEDAGATLDRNLRRKGRKREFINS